MVDQKSPTPAPAYEQYPTQMHQAPYGSEPYPQPQQQHHQPPYSPDELHIQTPPPQAYPAPMQSPPAPYPPPMQSYQAPPAELGSMHTPTHGDGIPMQPVPLKGYPEPAQSPALDMKHPQQYAQNSPVQNGGPHPSGYSTATPLHAIQRAPTPIDCPVCHARELTRVEAVTGNTNHGWAAIICCCFCLGCIPYLVTSLKDVNHHCGKCGVVVATWHASGHLEVHQNVRAV